jgi:hypothetical protein
MARSGGEDQRHVAQPSSRHAPGPAVRRCPTASGRRGMISADSPCCAGDWARGAALGDESGTAGRTRCRRGPVGLIKHRLYLRSPALPRQHAPTRFEHMWHVRNPSARNRTQTADVQCRSSSTPRHLMVAATASERDGAHRPAARTANTATRLLTPLPRRQSCATEWEPVCSTAHISRRCSALSQPSHRRYACGGLA